MWNKLELSCTVDGSVPTFTLTITFEKHLSLFSKVERMFRLHYVIKFLDRCPTEMCSYVHQKQCIKTFRKSTIYNSKI